MLRAVSKLDGAGLSSSVGLGMRFRIMRSLIMRRASSSFYRSCGRSRGVLHPAKDDHPPPICALLDGSNPTEHVKCAIAAFNAPNDVVVNRVRAIIVLI